MLIPKKDNLKNFEHSIKCILIGYEPKSKAYRCYHQSAQKVYISYHVHFIESHEGHKPLPMPTKENPPPPSNNNTHHNSIKPSAIIPTDADDVDPIIHTTPEVHPPIVTPTAEPNGAGPHRSSRVMIPTAKHPGGGQAATRLDKAIHNSKDSAEHVKAQCTEQKRILEGLHNIVASNGLPTDHDQMMSSADHDQIEELQEYLINLHSVMRCINCTH